MFLQSVYKVVSCFFFSVDVSNKTVGDPEGTGYTHAYNVEPITYIPADPHKNDRPVS